MPVPEEVDEIDEYLHLRKQRQAKGELPKPDYTPPFVKKFGQAILGKKEMPKPVLKSMHASNASNEAQAAMRKQIEEVMNERAEAQAAEAKRIRDENPIRPPLTMGPAPVDTRPRPSAPFVPPWTRTTAPAAPAPAAPPRPPINAQPPPRPASGDGSSMWSRFQAWMKHSSTAAPTSKGIPLPPKLPPLPTQPAAPAQNVSKAALQPVVPLVSVARQPGYTPIEGVKKIDPVFAAREKGLIGNTQDISPVTTRPRPTPVSAFSSPSSRALAASPAVPANPMNAPPWVRRTIPAQPAAGSISELSQRGDLSDLPWITAKEAAREKENTAPVKPFAPAVNETRISPNGAIASSMKRAGVNMPTPKPWVSGEVDVNVEARKTMPAKKGLISVTPIAPLPVKEAPKKMVQPAPLMSEKTAREEEISEEEALEQLPFDDVQGLTDSDLDYLERKEQEHRAQEAKKDPNYVAPEELKARLQQQTQRMNAALPLTPPDAAPGAPATPVGSPPAPTDDKEEILRRLKKIMEESGHISPE